MIGTTIGQYEVLEKLGEGGMGVVYKAQDTKLDRPVALKFLPQQLNTTEADRNRFIQEARAASALNHPNVCTIHDIQEHNGQLFLVMEFVDGQTLREKKSLTRKQAVEIGMQIADGLAAAHEKGIVHRDIKPENIMVRKDGIVQIMDFGLAKLRGVSRLTREGSTVGTAGYMSPEQIQGQDADHRSDIFSLGVVLYEIFTGAPPFKGVHETAISYEIVNVDPPPMTTAVPDIDPALDAIVLECLAKEPSERYQAVGEVAKELRRFKRESTRSRTMDTAALRVQPTSAGAPERLPLWRKAGFWQTLSAALALAAVVLAWRPWHTGDALAPGVMRFSLQLPLTAPLVGGASTIALSPDGRNFVYLGLTGGVPKLFLRPLDRLTAEPLAGTEGASDPFFSHDGRWIAFFAGGKLRKVSTFGGSPQDICDVPGFMRGGWWSPDDVIWFGQINSGISRVPAGGGTPTEATILDTTKGEISHRFPQLLPDGKTLMFTVKHNNITSFDDAVIAVENIETHERKNLLRGGSFARYTAPGFVTYARASSIYAVPFDPSASEPLAPPLPAEEGGMLNPLSGDANYGVSRTGLLIYAPVGAYSGLDATLAWIDKQGAVRPLLDSTRAYGEGSVSPDGEKIAMTIRAANDDIWVYHRTRGTLTRITFGGGNSGYPLWTQDGNRIVYLSERGRMFTISSKSWDGSGVEEPVGEVMNLDPTSWHALSPDGRTVAFGRQGDIWTMPLSGAGTPAAFIASPATEFNPDFSPDGRFMSFISNESGRPELYVVPFPDRKGKYQVSTGGAFLARWSADGRKLFYISGLEVMEVDISAGGSLDFSAPRRAVQLPEQWNGFWDVAADGRSFLVGLTRTTAVNTAQVNVVVGWTDELRRKFDSRSE
jgi:serine/threonine-protein kinase